VADAIAGFSGRVITPDDPGYRAARTIWNLAHDRRPAVIAQCRSTGDVVAALRHARERGLPVAVRAGGHNFAGLAAVQDGLVIDLRDLDGITVDPAARTARIGAGLTWGAVDPVLQRHGLVTTGGSVSGVGVAGFTLGSGLGWLGRAHGLAGDNLVRAEVVTAAGAVITADADRHPELYWALRGGTGNFGVVTAFTMRLFPLTNPVAGTLVFPAGEAPAVLRRLREATDGAPDTLNWAAVLSTAPPSPALPGNVRNRPVLLVPVFCTGSDPATRAVLERVRRIGRPAADTVGPVPFCAFQTATDDSAPGGMSWDVRSEWLSALDETAIDHAVAMACASPSPLSEFLFRPLGGAIRGAQAPGTPFSYRGAAFLAEVIANAPADTPAPHRDWLEASLAGLLRLSSGGPDVSHIGIGEDPVRVTRAFSAGVRDRLAAVKRAYDPDGVFWSVPCPLR
jgi:FAD/FMN-containing dehydrogenase